MEVVRRRTEGRKADVYHNSYLSRKKNRQKSLQRSAGVHDSQPTIYTSNIEIDKLKCDERAKDRIFELSYKIHMPEESIRRLRAERRRSEFMEQIK